MLLAAAAALVAAAAPSAGPAVWQPHEVTLTADSIYPQPAVWLSLQLNATLTHSASGLALEAPGFWDGGKTWKLRFAAPVAGEWRWRTSCSEAGDTGLHGAAGSFSVAPYAGSNALYRHGILRPHKSGRFLEHADGVPFYWLGDTHCERS